MDLEQKIGQLLIIGFKGAYVTPDSPVIRDIRKRNLGGVILFDRFLTEQSPDNNILSREQTTKLIADLQDGAATPLLVAVDQEGGKVNRFKKERGFKETPPAAELGSSPDTLDTSAAAEQTATLLAELGFNLNLAPVVDLDCYANNPIISRYRRSFASDPEIVAAHAAAWVRAHRKYGILTSLKHFPGHGSSREDSHLGFVDISHYWQPVELTPFKRLIDSGDVDTIMTGHLFNNVIDSEYPATLSEKAIGKILREKLGYRGPVLSDDMQMRAISSCYGLKEAVCRAIGAGVDLLIFGNNLEYEPDITKKVIEAATAAVRAGTLSEASIDAAWQRVQQLKQSLIKAQRT